MTSPLSNEIASSHLSCYARSAPRKDKMKKIMLKCYRVKMLSCLYAFHLSPIISCFRVNDYWHF